MLSFARHHGSSFEEPRRYGRLVGGLEVRQDSARRLARNALGAEQVLDANRNAAHGRRLAFGKACVGRPCLFKREIWRRMDHRIQCCSLFRRREACQGELHAFDLAGP